MNLYRHEVLNLLTLLWYPLKFGWECIRSSRSIEGKIIHKGILLYCFYKVFIIVNRDASILVLGKRPMLCSFTCTSKQCSNANIWYHMMGTSYDINHSDTAHTEILMNRQRRTAVSFLINEQTTAKQTANCALLKYQCTKASCDNTSNLIKHYKHKTQKQTLATWLPTILVEWK